MITGRSNTITLFLFRCRPGSVYLFFYLAIIFFSSCENDANQVKELTGNITLREEATGIQSYFSQQGQMKARLTAPLMLKVPAYDSPYVEFPEKLHVDFYDDSTRVETFLDSKYGKYFETLNKVYLKDSVIVITVQGDTLKTPDLWWDQNKKIFYTDKYAEYYSASKTIFGGKGLEATQDLRSVKFKYPTGTIKTSSAGFPE